MERLINCFGRQLVKQHASFTLHTQSYSGIRQVTTLRILPQKQPHWVGVKDKLLEPHCALCTFHQKRTLHLSFPLLSSKLKNTKKKQLKPIHFSPKTATEIVPIFHGMTVQELAEALGKDIDHVFEVMLYIKGTDRYDDGDIAIDDIMVIKEVVKKSGMKFRFEEKKKKKEKANKDAVRRPPPEPSMLQPRPPVVTIMGHVDHGKTTLLDVLRHSNVVSQEFGGITQHIGAFSVMLASGEKITFLDTPGHAAFHAMRSRGAHITDLIVLVVAADDGVMKQTEESIQHAKEAKVPIIVAINKIDKPDIDMERTKQSLLKAGIELEEYGGDVQAVPISALKEQNIDKLQEAIVAQAELLEIQGDPLGLVEGIVIESKTDIGRGKLSTTLVQRGTLRKGSVLVAGTAWAKVRGMFNDSGRPVTEALPGEAVEVIGWRDLPKAGEEILEIESERRAHEVVAWRNNVEKDKQATELQSIVEAKIHQHQLEYQAARQERLDKGFRRGAVYRKQRTKEVVTSHEGPELPIVVKGDVMGSVDALLDVLDSYESAQCRLHLLSYGVGSINEHDINMAASFNGIVYGFNVNIASGLLKLSQQKGVDIRLHNVIYKLIDDVKGELTLRLPSLPVMEILGKADVLQAFMITDKNRKLPVAGCRCTSGLLNRKKHFKLIRNEEVLFDGELTSLRHFKNEVATVKTDVECGIMLADHQVTPQAADTIVCYEIKEVPQALDWDLDF